MILSTYNVLWCLFCVLPWLYFNLDAASRWSQYLSQDLSIPPRSRYRRSNSINLKNANFWASRTPLCDDGLINLVMHCLYLVYTIYIYIYGLSCPQNGEGTNTPFCFGRENVALELTAQDIVDHSPSKNIETQKQAINRCK